ncbi:hypothetical protein [Solicola sp. PLA-1-18]|uniref:hypothetical protein n=1 Tax=Solicola sp. PLA-1-18 TaxID=3380532 RepID=UPI003B7FBC25
MPLGVLVWAAMASGVVLMWIGWTRPLVLSPAQRARRRRTTIVSTLILVAVVAVLAVLQVVSARS